MPIEITDKDDYRWGYIPDGQGYRLFESTDEDNERDGMVKKRYEDDGGWFWVYPEKERIIDNAICPVCLSKELELTPKFRRAKNTCSSPVCREVYKYFSWEIKINHFAPIPEDYECNQWVENGDGIRRAQKYNNRYDWKWWQHRDDINKKRAEILAIMYLEGAIELSEDAIPYLDKNYCKPIKYKQSIKRFSYENFKSNADTLGSNGWSDLLLSGITPTRSKSPEHAKHH